MKRRGWLLAGAGAAAAGLGLGWRASREGPAEPAPEELWNLRLPRPEGGELAFADLRGQPLLVNFWATWCAPCVKEMPDLDRFHRAFSPRGWQVVGLAIDGPTPVREFLKKTPVGFAIGLAGFDGTGLAIRLGNAQGALPFSIAIDRSGHIRQRKLGQTHYDELVRWGEAS